MVLLINYLENSESVAFADVAVEGDQLIWLVYQIQELSTTRITPLAQNKATRHLQKPDGRNIF